MNSLPNELLLKIIRFLPWKSKAKYRLVCKSWDEIINDRITWDKTPLNALCISACKSKKIESIDWIYKCVLLGDIYFIGNAVLYIVRTNITNKEAINFAYELCGRYGPFPDYDPYLLLLRMVQNKQSC